MSKEVTITIPVCVRCGVLVTACECGKPNRKP